MSVFTLESIFTVLLDANCPTVREAPTAQEGEEDRAQRYVGRDVWVVTNFVSGQFLWIINELLYI